MNKCIENLQYIKGIDDNCKINLTALDIKDVDWFIGESITDYFNEYLDFKFSTLCKDIKSREKVINALREKLEACAKRINKKEKRFIIKYNGMRVGNLALSERDKNKIEMAYYINSNVKGLGIATEAVKMFIDILEQERYKGEIYLVIQMCNKGSIKVAEKAGFKLSGCEKGKYTTNLIYSIIM